MSDNATFRPRVHAECPGCGVLPGASDDGLMEYPHTPTCDFYDRAVIASNGKITAEAGVYTEPDWPPEPGDICPHCDRDGVLHVVYPDDLAGPCPHCGHPVYAWQWHVIGAHESCHQHAHAAVW